MSKFNKIISIILVTIMIGLIPINTNNVKAYEIEEIQVKSASTIGDILLYIIYGVGVTELFTEKKLYIFADMELKTLYIV